MSRRWPGWEDLGGIDVAGGVNAAQKQGREYVLMRVVAGPRGANGYLQNYPVAFYADGRVRVYGDEDEKDYHCEIDGGMLTAIVLAGEDVPADQARQTLVKVLYVAIPDGDPPAFLNAYVAGQFAGGEFRREIDAAIDASPNEDGSHSSSLTIMLCPERGQVTTASWAITPESAYALIGLLREQHGEPVVEVMTTTDEMDAVSHLVHGRPGITILTNHEHAGD